MSKIPQFTRCRRVAAAALLLINPLATWSQADEVVVTGSVRAQGLLAAPFAISRVDAEDLRSAGPMVNLSEVMAQVPGVVVNNRNNYAQDLQISARGFGARAAFGVRGLRLYADGIPATGPDGQGQVAHFDLAAAERLEVLRGPFSVLYGNSSGGVIALFSAPVRNGQSEVALDAGSFGLRQGRVSVASPLGAVAGGALDLRVSGTRLDVDGARPQSAANRQLGNAQLGWRSDTDQLTLQLSDHQQQAQDPLGLSRAQLAADPTQTTPQASLYNTRKTLRQSQAGLSWRHRFADGGALRDSHLMLYQGSRGVTQWQSIPFTVQAPASQGGGVVDFDRGYGGGEIRLGWRFGDADLVTGLSIETQQDERRGFENFSGSGTARVLGVSGKLRRDETNRASSRDGFAQLQMPLGGLDNALTLTAGLRGGQVKLRTDDRYLSNGDDSGALAFSYLNPVLGLRWQPMASLALHASAARGFESPTLGELAYRSDGGAGFNPALKGQSSRQFELGAKWRRADWRVDAALFTVDTEHEIGVFSNSGGRSSFQNVGTTRRNGAELSLRWQVSPGFRLQAVSSLLQASYRDGFGSGASAVAAGNRIAGTQRASAWAQAAWQPGVLPGEWALEWRALARTAVNDINSDFAAGYSLAALRWSGKLALGPTDALELLARVDNLFNRVHVGSVIVNDGNGRFFEPGLPRNGLLSARWLHRW